MKYTIPYDDKIILPHIKNIETIGINTDNLYYDQKELTGEVIITGDYSLDNSSDIMEFIHNIPVSFLIDDANIIPQINIANFKYELIAGRGIEVIFDLDVILASDENEEKRDEKEKVIEEEIIEEVTDEKEVIEDKDVLEFQEKVDENLDKIINDERESISDEEELVKEIDTIIEEEKEIIKTNVQTTHSTFDTSFVPREHDRYTTYKVLLIEKNESINDVLEARNLAKALICKEYNFSDDKIVLKIEDD